MTSRPAPNHPKTLRRAPMLALAAGMAMLVGACKQEKPATSPTAAVVTPNPSAAAGPTAQTRPVQAKPKREPIYNELADAQLDITQALQRAKPANKRVLLMYGGNWCSWCYRFNDLIHNDPKIAPVLEKSYELVHVDNRSNPKIEAGYGKDPKQGYPYLTVLDSDGKLLCNQETGVFEEGQGYKPAVVLEFFLKYRPGAATPTPTTAPAQG